MSRYLAASATLVTALANPVALLVQPPGAPPQGAAQNTANAVSAAPQELGATATVMDWDHSVLRQGTNGSTCFPDVPNTPGNAPMCLDAQWVKWAETPAPATPG